MFGPNLRLVDGSRVGVVGGGPAGSFFTYFLLEFAERAGIKLAVDVYEPREFERCGPAGCNHCGGIISESLVQTLATEGIILPPDVVKTGIAAYRMHTELGSVTIRTPLAEKRIAAVHRTAGPLGMEAGEWRSFDGFLQKLTEQRGANAIRARVQKIERVDGRPVIHAKGAPPQTYDLVAGAVGIDSDAYRMFVELGIGYRPPQRTKTFICEFKLGPELVERHFGDAMHVFLLDIPKLKFAALIPKHSYVTLCILGRDIDKEFVQTFLAAPAVRNCFPPGLDLAAAFPCQCHPHLSLGRARRPYGDRVVLIGDCAIARLYKDGIGSAHNTARAAASASVLYGVSARDYRRRYLPVVRRIDRDNLIGKLVFAVTGSFQRRDYSKNGILRMVAREQALGTAPRMSAVLWDAFTGSAPYREIFLRTLNPLFQLRLAWESIRSLFPGGRYAAGKEDPYLPTRGLGRTYLPGEDVVTQDEPGDSMFVIYEGTCDVIQRRDGKDVEVATLGPGEFFGEMAVFERAARAATVRAKTRVRAVTIDKRTLLRQVREDPALAFRIVEKLCARIRELDRLNSRMQASDRRNWRKRAEQVDRDTATRLRKGGPRPEAVSPADAPPDRGSGV